MGRFNKEIKETKEEDQENSYLSLDLLDLFVNITLSVIRRYASASSVSISDLAPLRAVRIRVAVSGNNLAK